MNPLLIEAALAGIEWAISRAEASGEEIPQDHLNTRTELRRELARQADEEAT